MSDIFDSDGIVPLRARFNRLSRKFRNRREKRKYDHERKSEVGRKYNDGLVFTNDEDTDFSAVDQRPEFFLSGVSLNDHYISKIVDERTRLGKKTISDKQIYVADYKSWISFSRKAYNDLQIVEFSKDAGLIIDRKEVAFIDYSVNSNSVEIKICGSLEFVEFHKKLISKNFDTATCHIEWIYSGDGSSVQIPLTADRLPIAEMYPFLKEESIEDYYDRFMKSSASILLLIGPPGTGKTTFIRGLLHHLKKNAVVTYDEKILERDFVFARFLEDDASVMVIEDADNFLMSRKEGNTMMHRFLNVGDGLVGIQGKKLIFSTNLPSVKDIDPALIRAGRCFDILHFENYNEEQAKKIAKKFKVQFNKKTEGDYSLAEIFHSQNKTPKVETKIGFY
jgi:molybdopterin-guanine dinucleotide biosynthesis protein